MIEQIPNKWIVVADSASAKIYKASRVTEPLTPIRHFSCEAARKNEQELVSDRSGRSFDSFGAGRHETSPSTSAKQQNAQRFAGEVADFLEHHRGKGEIKSLYLIADPRFLGLIRNALNKEVSKLVVKEVNKDLTRIAVSEINAYLSD